MLYIKSLIYYFKKALDQEPTMLFKNIVFALLLFTNSITAQSVVIGWNWLATDTSNISHVNIYRSLNETTGFNLIGSGLPKGIFIDSTANYNQHYFFAAKAVSQNGKESTFSNIIDTLFTRPTSIDLITLSLKSSSNIVTLRWKITDSNLHQFEVERSKSESGLFQRVGTVMFEPGRQDYVFQENISSPDSFSYRIKFYHIDGSYRYSETNSINIAIPQFFAVSDNYPNPFNGSTTIHISVPEMMKAKIDILNVTGQTVRSISEKDMPKGEYQISWDGRDQNGNQLPSGEYFFRIQAYNNRKLSISNGQGDMTFADKAEYLKVVKAILVR